MYRKYKNFISAMVSRKAAFHIHMRLLKNSATGPGFLLVVIVKCATQMFRRSTLNDG